MKKISSRWLFFPKKVFPVLWFGFLSFFVAQALAFNAGPPKLFFVFVPCVMAVFGYLMLKHLVWDLADEVFDCGDHLLLRKGTVEERVSLADVTNISASILLNPPRVTLRLDRPTKLGSEIAFSPAAPVSLNPFRRNAIAEDLIKRVDQARYRRVS